MSALKFPEEGMLFFSIIISEEIEEEELLEQFSSWDIWGKAQFNFNPSLEYYSREMGGNLRRFFWVGGTFSRDVLVKAKVWAQNLENFYSFYSKDSRRKVNCDPGIVCKEQMLLATGKSYAHRVHLHQGVYAELTYLFKEGAFNSLQWTYPDYQDMEKVDFFNLLRIGLFEK